MLAHQHDYAEDQCDCYWLYVVTNCNAEPVPQDPIKDPARFPWHEVRMVAHDWLEVDALTKPMQVREPEAPPYSSACPSLGKRVCFPCPA